MNRAQWWMSPAVLLVLARMVAGQDNGEYTLKPSVNAYPERSSKEPKLALSFSIQRHDKRPFPDLKHGDIVARLTSGVVVPFRLQPNQSKAGEARVLLMVDVSGSMLYPYEQLDDQFNKMKAVKDALKYLLGEPGREAPDSAAMSVRLEKTVKVAIAAFFDEAITSSPASRLLPLTEDRKAAIEAVEQIAANRENRPTALYHAMEAGLEQAKGQGISHILVLTDGKDETSPDYKRKAKARYQEWQRVREATVFQIWEQKGPIPIHSVGIGNRNAGFFSNARVDCDALERVSRKTGGVTSCIDTTELQETYQSRPEEYKRKLTAALGEFLSRLSESIEHQYSVEVAMDASTLSPGRNVLSMEVHAGGAPVTMEVPFEWGKDSGFGSVGRPTLVPSVQVTEEYPRIHRIFLGYAGALLVLALMPRLARAAGGVRAQLTRNRAVHKVNAGSKYIGEVCPNEERLGPGWRIKPGDVIVECPNPQCAKVHHARCWKLADGHKCWDCGQYLRID